MVSAVLEVVFVQLDVHSNHLALYSGIGESDFAISTELIPFSKALLVVAQAQVEVLVGVFEGHSFLQGAFFYGLQTCAQHTAQHEVVFGQSKEVVGRDFGLVVLASEIESDILHRTGVPKGLETQRESALLEVLLGEQLSIGVKPEISGAHWSLHEVVVSLEVQHSPDTGSVKLELGLEALNGGFELHAINGVSSFFSAFERG